MQVSPLIDSSLIRFNTKYDTDKTHDDTQSDLKNDKKSKEKSSQELTPEEEIQVKKLQARDVHVRAHEAAHIAAGGGVVKGGASFTYQQGPDGKSYAIGGEVPIDVSTESDPQKTIAKMQKVRSAALAPADPSPQDYKVASTATILEMQARVELMREKTKQSEEKNSDQYEKSQEEEYNKIDLSA